MPTTVAYVENNTTRSCCIDRLAPKIEHIEQVETRQHDRFGSD